MLRREVEEGACWVVVLNFFFLINISVDPLHIWGASQARHTGTNTPGHSRFFVSCIYWFLIEGIMGRRLGVGKGDGQAARGGQDV